MEALLMIRRTASSLVGLMTKSDSKFGCSFTGIESFQFLQIIWTLIESKRMS